jgi:5-methylcytosine-specific restriction endonuclease McrA
VWLNKPERRRRAYVLLAQRQGPTCAYCRVRLTEPGLDGATEPTTRTLDHFIPKSRGGSSLLDNIVLACDRCNGAKGDKLPLEFIASKVWACPA